MTVDIDLVLIAAIDRAAQLQGLSRSAAIREALETWLAHRPRSAQWSTEFMNRLEL
jgi:metal-responsive CopG/Arc/MetJ family transcriptional regulator